ncbi:MAG: hypothetical protein ABFD97_12660 [Syntrophobacter sp.]
MQGWTQYFANYPDFGLSFLMKVPDHCIAFVLLIWCMILILSIEEKRPGEEFED